MKYWLLVFLLFSSFASYGQNIYQHFSELKGMEDYNGNTNLLYRMNSVQKYTNSEIDSNSIYLLNTSNKIDSLFQLDYGWTDVIFDGYSRNVLGYDFWEKNPRKYIVCGVYGSMEPYPFVDRFDKTGIFTNFMGEVTFIGISRQNDSLVYCTFWNNQLFKSTNGGMTWDSGVNFGATSLSPYNDKVLFTSDYSKLYKTIDGGLTKIMVDSIPLDIYRRDQIYYDKDTNYVYSIVNYYNIDHRTYQFLVSDKSGNANSWRMSIYATNQMFVSLDHDAAGSVYIASGNRIWHSSDFGNSFSIMNSLARNLVGIYKKPGSSKLYAATSNSIYEIDGTTINVIKQIPLDKEIFKFDPLDIGNKWIYKSRVFVPEAGMDYVHSKEIIKDTVLANLQSFRQIKSVTMDSFSNNISYSYERIDSLTGKVYSWNSGSGIEYQIDDLSISLGDTINVSRFGSIEQVTSFDSLNLRNIFGFSKDNRVYNSRLSYLGYGDRYWLTKDIGLTYHLSTGDLTSTVNNLKGAVIKGVVYGDTSFVIVGINDIVPDLPKEFVLSQNYPNPFNPSTTINYSLPKAGNVKLTVYNSIGSKVATIVNEYKPAGNYSIQFNGSNLASGIYLYRLESGDYSAVKKFVLLK